MALKYLEENMKLITEELGEDGDYHCIVKYGVTIHTPLLKKFIELSNKRKDNKCNFSDKIRNFNHHRDSINCIMDTHASVNNKKDKNKNLEIMLSSKFFALALILLTYLSDYNNEIIINDNKNTDRDNCITSTFNLLVDNL